MDVAGSGATAEGGVPWPGARSQSRSRSRSHSKGRAWDELMGGTAGPLAEGIEHHQPGVVGPLAEGIEHHQPGVAGPLAESREAESGDAGPLTEGVEPQAQAGMGREAAGPAGTSAQGGLRVLSGLRPVPDGEGLGGGRSPPVAAPGLRGGASLEPEPDPEHLRELWWDSGRPAARAVAGSSSMARGGSSLTRATSKGVAAGPHSPDGPETWMASNGMGSGASQGALRPAPWASLSPLLSAAASPPSRSGGGAARAIKSISTSSARSPSMSPSSTAADLMTNNVTSPSRAALATDRGGGVAMPDVSSMTPRHAAASRADMTNGVGRPEPGSRPGMAGGAPGAPEGGAAVAGAGAIAGAGVVSGAWGASGAPGGLAVAEARGGVAVAEEASGGVAVAEAPGGLAVAKAPGGVAVAAAHGAESDGPQQSASADEPPSFPAPTQPPAPDGSSMEGVAGVAVAGSSVAAGTPAALLAAPGGSGSSVGGVAVAGCSRDSSAAFRAALRPLSLPTAAATASLHPALATITSSGVATTSTSTGKGSRYAWVGQPRPHQPTRAAGRHEWGEG